MSATRRSSSRCTGSVAGDYCRGSLHDWSVRNWRVAARLLLSLLVLLALRIIIVSLVGSLLLVHARFLNDVVERTLIDDERLVELLLFLFFLVRAGRCGLPGHSRLAQLGLLGERARLPFICELPLEVRALSGEHACGGVLGRHAIDLVANEFFQLIQICNLGFERLFVRELRRITPLEAQQFIDFDFADGVPVARCRHNLIYQLVTHGLLLARRRVREHLQALICARLISGPPIIWLSICIYGSGAGRCG